MTTINTSTLTKVLSGSIGNLIAHKPQNNNPINRKTSSTVNQSELQLEARFKFKCACAYAKSAMLNKEKLAYYTDISKKLKIRNAYTAAVSDYMRKGEIKTINLYYYRGRAGDTINLNIYKKDFAVNQVKVGIYQPDGRLLESDTATQENDIFVYTAKTNIYGPITLTIRVMLCDHIMNMVTREVKTLII